MALLLFVLFAEVSVATPRPRMRPDDEYVVPAERGPAFLRGWRSVAGDRYWTPSQGEIDLLRQKLKARLSAPAQQEKDMGLRSLDGYFRHYVGVVRWVDAFELDDYTKKIVRVDQPFPGVADGGCGFWRIWFDVAKGQLSAIDCNGEA